MATITEAYVSFEVAKLLKEKGFNEPVWTRYEDNNEVIFDDKYDWNNSPMGQTSAPTHQMAMKWLREEKGLFVEICCDDLDYNWQILDIWHRDANEDPIIKSASYGGYNEYEKAV